MAQGSVSQIITGTYSVITTYYNSNGNNNSSSSRVAVGVVGVGVGVGLGARVNLCRNELVHELVPLGESLIGLSFCMYVVVDHRLRIRPSRKGTLLILSQVYCTPKCTFAISCFWLLYIVIRFFSTIVAKRCPQAVLCLGV